MSKNKAADFLANMQLETQSTATSTTPPVQVKAKHATSTSTNRGKHIGGYLSDDVTEKFALLRIRLKLDNSELLALAINDLYTKQKAKKAFGD